MREDDLSYFSRRALQEQVAAQQTVCEAARLRHDELATMYRFRATMLSRGLNVGQTLQQFNSP